jgi:energy-coupling factor transporter ATP-binding protein EcfA2
LENKDLAFLNGNRKIILLGEGGSGKSELSLNLAVLIRHTLIRQSINEEVRFLDMDQTKPLLRSRDVGDDLRVQGITFRAQEQFMDAPIVPCGVIESLTNTSSWTILDVGGSQAGALCLGQFSDTILSVKARVYYTINPYRPFSDTTDRICQTMQQILSFCRVEQIHILSNPYLGPDTTLEQLLKGNEMLTTLLKPMNQSISLTAISSHLWEAAWDLISGEVIRIYPYLWKVLGIARPSA